MASTSESPAGARPDAASQAAQAEAHLELFKAGRDPTLPPNHPVNALSDRRKFAILCTLSFVGLLANFAVTINQTGFVKMGAAFGVSPGDIANAIGYNLLGLAVGPLFWNPLSRTVGRRPVYLAGSLLFMATCIWMALSPTYASFSVARTVAGLTSAWSQTVPPATIAEIYPKEVRGAKMSAFAVAVVIAPALAPIFGALIVNWHSWRIMFWFILALGGLQFILLFVFVPETLWVEDAVEQSPSSSNGSSAVDLPNKEAKQEVEAVENSGGVKVVPGHVGVLYYPWSRPGAYLRECFAPIIMLQYVVITIPSIWYGMVFGWSVGITVNWPQLAEVAPYSFTTLTLGASFLAFGLGGVLGKWSGGIVGDKVVTHLERRKGYRQPEHRMWALLPILPFMLISLCIVGVALQKELHWSAILVGGGLYFFCLSATTGITQTYVLETHLPQSSNSQAVFLFMKCIFAFGVTLFVYDWGQEEGLLASYAAQAALVSGLGGIIAVGLIWKGYEIRKWQGMPVTPRE